MFNPFDTTSNTNWYKDILNLRHPGFDATDAQYIVQQKYNWRPDRAAFELYGNSELWWIFIVMNRSAMTDPIFDFSTGKVLRVPSKSRLLDFIGGVA